MTGAADPAAERPGNDPDLRRLAVAVCPMGVGGFAALRALSRIPLGSPVMITS